jgi:futalosine hydrolase
LNAALEMGAALSRHEITGVVNLGLAGSYDLEKAPLGSCVTGLDPTDCLADDTGFPFPQWEGRGQRVVRRIGLDPVAAAWSLELMLPSGQRMGTALTVAGVTGSRDRARILAGRFDALTESMEGFAIALACATRGLPFLEVRTISNAVGERDRDKWKLKQALQGLGAMLAKLLSGPGPL